MNKILFCIVLLFSHCALAATQGSMRVLVLDSQNGEPYLTARLAFLAELEHWSSISGQHIETAYFSAQGKEGLATRILQIQADNNYNVIFVNGTTANIAAYKFGFNNKKYTFVFCSVTDPVGIGLVKELNRPTDTNFTGVAYPVSVEERLNFLKEVLPNVKKIGVIYADMSQSHSYNRWLDQAIAKKKFNDLQLIYRKVEHVTSNQGFLRMARIAEKYVEELDSQVDVFLTPSDQLGTHREFAESVTAHSTKPLMGLTEHEIKSNWGAHFAYYMDQNDAGRTAATMVIRLLQGTKIEDIPPVSPQGAYGINMKRSQEIGLHYPQSALEKAKGNIVH